MSHASRSGPETGAAEYEEAVLRVMIDIMIADGQIRPGEFQTIRGLYERLTGRPIDDAAVQAAMRKIELDDRPVEDYLSSMTNRMTDQGRQMVIKAAFVVAAADGELQDEEKSLIVSIGQAMDQTEAWTSDVIASLVLDG